MPKKFDEAKKKVFGVVMANELGVGYTIYFNKSDQALEELVGDDIAFCFFYSLEQVGDSWIWRDIMGKDPDRIVDEDQLNRYPELRHYITRESHEELGTMARARTQEQYLAMKKSEEEKKCPFCPPYEWKYPAIKEGQYWILKPNDFPYNHTSHHLVLLLKKHGNENDVAPVSAEAWIEFGEMIQWAIDHFKMPGGGIVLRFGNPDYNASTVRHLHWHIQVPDLTGNVKATFAKDRSAEEQKRRDKRLQGFQQ